MSKTSTARSSYAKKNKREYDYTAMYGKAFHLYDQYGKSIGVFKTDRHEQNSDRQCHRYEVKQ